MSIAYIRRSGALGRVAVLPEAPRSRRCCSMLRARLVTHSGGRCGRGGGEVGRQPVEQG